MKDPMWMNGDPTALGMDEDEEEFDGIDIPDPEDDE